MGKKRYRNQQGNWWKKKTVLQNPGLMKLAPSFFAFFAHAIAQIDLHPFLSIELLAIFHHFHWGATANRSFWVLHAQTDSGPATWEVSQTFCHGWRSDGTFKGVLVSHPMKPLHVALPTSHISWHSCDISWRYETEARHARERHAIERPKQCKKPLLISEWTVNAILHFQEWAHAATEKTSTHWHIVESSSTKVRPFWRPKCIYAWTPPYTSSEVHAPNVWKRGFAEKKDLFFCTTEHIMNESTTWGTLTLQHFSSQKKNNPTKTHSFRSTWMRSTKTYCYLGIVTGGFKMGSLLKMYKWLVLKQKTIWIHITFPVVLHSPPKKITPKEPCCGWIFHCSQPSFCWCSTVGTHVPPASTKNGSPLHRLWVKMLREHLRADSLESKWNLRGPRAHPMAANSSQQIQGLFWGDFSSPWSLDPLNWPWCPGGERGGDVGEVNLYEFPWDWFNGSTWDSSSWMVNETSHVSQNGGHYITNPNFLKITIYLQFVLFDSPPK